MGAFLKIRNTTAIRYGSGRGERFMPETDTLHS
jgi:hypothetical protein